MSRYLPWLVLSCALLLNSGCGGGGTPDFDDEPEEVVPSPQPSAAAPAPAPPPPPPPPPSNSPTAEQAEAAPENLQEQSLSNLERIAEALDEYSKQHDRFLPAAISDRQGSPLLSWRVALLPFLDEGDLYARFNRDEPWDSVHNRSLLKRMPEVFKTPGGPPAPKTCYLAPVGLGTIFSSTAGLRRNEILDDLTDTLALVEADREVVWTQPDDWRFIPAQPKTGLGGRREGPFLAATAEATVYAIPGNLQSNDIRAMFTYAGGERIDLAQLATSEPVEDVPDAADAADAPGVPAAGVPEEPADEKMLVLGRKLMGQGRERLGIMNLLGDLVIRADPQVMATVRWSPGLKRPMLATRWGLATLAKHVEVKAQPAIDPKRIPDGYTPDMFQQPRSSARNFGPLLPGSNPADAMQFWGAKVGTLLVKRMKTRVAAKDFGQWFGDYRQFTDKQRRSEAKPEPLPVIDPEQIPEGHTADSYIAMIKAKHKAKRAAGTAGSKLRMPGVVVLDATDAAQLRSMAVREGLDVVLVGNIAAKPGRGRAPPQTILTLHIIDPIDGRELWQSKPLSNLRVADPTGIGGDPAGELVDTAMKVVDTRFRLGEMPAISPEAAQRRATSLAKKQMENPLPALAELRYYHWKKLLTVEQLVDHYVEVVGAIDGQRLATGDEKQRGYIVRRFVPLK